MQKFWLGSLICVVACSSSDPESEYPANPDPNAITAPFDYAEPCHDNPSCDDGVVCTLDRCINDFCVHRAPDQDGDGYGDRNCADDQGRAYGDDCDDTDSNRFPGNPEYCTLEEPGHDEDCNSATIGLLDADGDLETNEVCTNPGGPHGTDCNDLDLAVRTKQVEFCDLKDNNCNGLVDDDPQPVMWYRDADDDRFGGKVQLGESCAPIKGGALLDTDCNDETTPLHPSQLEACDGIDNDCNGIADDSIVCHNVPGVGPAVLPGGTAPEPATLTATAEGGLIMDPDLASLVLAPGAVEEPVDLKIRVAEISSLVGLPPGFAPVSRAYSLTPHGKHFDGRVEFNVPYVNQGTGAVKVFRLNHEADETWVDVTKDLGADTAKIVTDRFSVYVVAQEGARVSGDSDAGLGGDGDGDDDPMPTCRALGLEVTPISGCVFELDRAPVPANVVVRLGGERLRRDDPDGFTVVDRMLTLSGAACTDWESVGLDGLEVIVTCGAISNRAHYQDAPSCLTDVDWAQTAIPSTDPCGQCPGSLLHFTRTGTGTYAVMEIGCAGATGTATFDGAQVRAEVSWSGGSGVYTFPLNGCQGGQGTFVFATSSCMGSTLQPQIVPNGCCTQGECLGGSYVHTCRNCSCGDGQLTCECGDGIGWPSSSLALPCDRDIANCGGQLRCGGCDDPVPCIPQSCEELGVACGTTDDGCGTTLNCTAGCGASLTLVEFCEALYSRRLEWADRLETCCGDTSSAAATQLLDLFGPEDAADTCIASYQPLIENGSVTYVSGSAEACASAFVQPYLTAPASCPENGFALTEMRWSVGHGAPVGVQIPVCRATLVGNLGADAACTDSFQCADSRRCLPAPGGVSTCQTAVGPGGACSATHECADGHTCVGDPAVGRTCVSSEVLGNQGEGCSHSRECRTRYVCTNDDDPQVTGGVCALPSGPSAFVCNL